MKNQRSSRVSIIILMTMLILLGSITSARAQEGTLAPAEITGEAIYIPFPVEITLDGDLGDWSGIPFVTVDRGTMLSETPGENDHFTFAVVADMEHIYVAMTMPDQNIITQQHGADTWNEDSLEFFFNFTEDINARSYNIGMFQVRIIPGDIGNTLPEAMSTSGTFHADAMATGFVFSTDDGWGFEAMVPISDYFEPTHGQEVGFQAQANGASQLNRDVKLIWSNADATDDSWRDPSLFGTAIFFEVGSSDIPLPSDRNREMVEEIEEELPPVINVNQHGYYPIAPKIASFDLDNSAPVSWRLLHDGQEILTGESVVFGDDPASGDFVHQIDFSEASAPGKGYILEIDSMASEPFDISGGLYQQLKTDALTYFYLSRSGIELEESYTGAWARPAGHLTDDDVTCFKGQDDSGRDWPGCDYSLDVSGGWYDAGDYGKYVVNGGITAWTLMNIYERNPESFPDGSLLIPESSNGLPDILDEVRWELEFLLAMQVPEGQEGAGLVHHKMHDRTWETMPAMPVTERDNDNNHQDPANGRYLFAPSTAATLNLAAAAAQCSRIWEEIDAEFADRCLLAAQRAWEAAIKNPSIFLGSVPGSGGGDYGDETVSDEFYWAAAELYTATREDEYLNFLQDSPHWMKIGSPISAMTWNDTAALGSITLATVPNRLPFEDVTSLREQIIAVAQDYLDEIEAQGYRMPIRKFEWGSNSFVLNNALFLGLAYELSGEQEYLDGMTESMDYLLGRNPNGFSYLTGYGERAAQHPHHRFWANDPDRGWPAPPPGVVVGGPNATADDPPYNESGLSDSAPAKRYIDELESYSTNEVAINWNAPLAWVSTAIDEYKKGIVPDRSEETWNSQLGGSSFPTWAVYVGIFLLAVLVIASVLFLIRRSRTEKAGGQQLSG